METLEEAKFVLDVRNTTQHLLKQTHKCQTWKELAQMLILEFSKDKGLIAAAPDLLEACNQAVEAASVDITTLTDPAKFQARIVRYLTAAIAKATI